MRTLNKFGVCIDCGRIKRIANRTKQLCDECNYKRLHDGKTRFQVAIEKQKSKPHETKKATGELKLFKEIWAEREHKCVKCGKDLGVVLKPQYFSHIKSKGAFPELRLDKTNIELLCCDCHHQYEFGSRK